MPVAGGLQKRILVLLLYWGEQLIEPDPVKHLRAKSVDDSKGDLGPILRRIDMHAKRALAEWRVDYLNDGLRDRADIGVVGHDSSESLLDSLAVTFIGSFFILH